MYLRLFLVPFPDSLHDLLDGPPPKHILNGDPGFLGLILLQVVNLRKSRQFRDPSHDEVDLVVVKEAGLVKSFIFLYTSIKSTMTTDRIPAIAMKD